MLFSKKKDLTTEAISDEQRRYPIMIMLFASRRHLPLSIVSQIKARRESYESLECAQPRDFPPNGLSGRLRTPLCVDNDLGNCEGDNVPWLLYPSWCYLRTWPSIYLEVTAHAKFSDTPKKRETRAIDNMLQIMTGLRPNLSAAHPQK